MTDVQTDNPAEETALAATVAPEDLRCGDYVSLLNEVFELPSWLWNCDAPLAPGHEYVRVQLAARDGGTPLKVQAICLPFVLLKTPKGKHRTVDLRSCQLVRLSAEYARRAWIAMRKKRKRKSKAKDAADQSKS